MLLRISVQARAHSLRSLLFSPKPDCTTFSRTIERPGATLETGASISKLTSVGFSSVPETPKVNDRWRGGSHCFTWPCHRTVPVLETSSTRAPGDHPEWIVPQHACRAFSSVKVAHTFSGVDAMWIMYSVCRSVM